MPWYRVRFSVEQLAAGRAVELFDRFLERLRVLDYPPPLALFCEETYPAATVFYLSPAARIHCRDLLNDFNGISADAPRYEEVLLIAGSKDSVSVLFPPSERSRGTTPSA